MTTPAEPQLDAAEIQGNIVPGFLKPHMSIVALAMGDADSARAWITSIVTRITTLKDAMPSHQAVREHRRNTMPMGLNPRPVGVNDAWLNIAFTHAALTRLLAGDPTRLAELALFTDPAFALGMPQRSSLLGDPTDPTAEGHPRNWRVGAPGREPDALLIVSADRADDLDQLQREITTGARAADLAVLYQENAAKLTDRGSEHFGFKDGISQPGVRGAWGPDGAPVTPRLVDPSAQPESELFGLPGQNLVWPGEFVFGYPREGADPLLPGTVHLPGPGWSRNGSYLVFRRLRQDVAGFRRFIDAEATRLAMDATELASLLVGRWPSGAPVSRSPRTDNPMLASSRVANNYFLLGADAPPLPLVSEDDGHPMARADPLGLVCPLSAHIRKVNPRDAASDAGGRRATFNRRILRRGLPFGPLLEDGADDPADGDRGLLFVSYQASITGQFEFLCSQWMGDPTNPRMPSGHDMIVGQNGQPGDQRERHCVLLSHDSASDVHTAELRTSTDFVIPTGGGYFFSPSITALRDVISGVPRPS